jgi:hypothetical protein
MTMVARPTVPSEAPDQPSRCQIVDTVHDAKVNISRELDVIRDRLGRPLAREVIDRSDPQARLGFAAAFVDAQLTAGRCSGVDRTVYVELVDAHLTPLPDREWPRRHSITSTARRHAPRVERDQDHSRPDALAPVLELLERRAARQRADDLAQTPDDAA